MIRNDTETLDWLLENATIRDFLTDDKSFVLEEGREAIHAAMDEVGVAPICPGCGDNDKVFFFRGKWACHNTHRI